MKTPVVELDGDEMTRIWGLSQDRLIQPYLDTDLKYYVLGIEYRDKIEDRVTVGASQRHPPERRHDRKRQQHNRCSSHQAGQRVSESTDGLAGILSDKEAPARAQGTDSDRLRRNGRRAFKQRMGLGHCPTSPGCQGRAA